MLQICNILILHKRPSLKGRHDSTASAPGAARSIMGPMGISILSRRACGLLLLGLPALAWGQQPERVRPIVVMLGAPGAGRSAPRAAGSAVASRRIEAAAVEPNQRGRVSEQL